MGVFFAFLIFMILFAILFWGVFRTAGGRSAETTRFTQRSSAPPTHTASRFEPPRPKVRANMVAQQAMQRAGYQADDQYVRVSDVGLLAYQEESQPKLLRFEKISTDSDYVRPFVELSVPYRSRGVVRFELIEILRTGEQRLRYADEEQYDLHPGANVLLPSTWLPLTGKRIQSDRWRLAVRVGDTILAEHLFGWRSPVDKLSLKHHMVSDGEISPALQKALTTQPREAVSLDELLGQ